MVKHFLNKLRKGSADTIKEGKGDIISFSLKKDRILDYIFNKILLLSALCIVLFVVGMLIAL